MKHWQYTDIPSVCQQCGYKTCSLPTFKRHVKHCSVLTSTLGPENVVSESCEGPAGIAPLECSSCDFSAGDENLVLHVKLCHPDKVTTEEMNEECGFIGSLVLDDGKLVAEQSTPAEDKPLANDSTTCSLPVENPEAKTNDENELVATDAVETSGSSSSGTKPEVLGKKPSRKSLVADVECKSHKASPRTNRRSADKMASPDESAAPSRKPSQMSHEPKVLVVEGHALFCCMLCDFLSSDEKTTRSHIKCCSERAKKYYCSKCDFSCDDKLVLVKHRLQHNVNESGQKTIYSCLECLYKTPLKKNFERHRACHSSVAAVKCSFCTYSSTGESAVRRHISTYHCFPDGPVDGNAKTLDLENEEALPAVEAYPSSLADTPQKSTKEKQATAAGSVKSVSRDQRHSKQSSPSETKTRRSVKISHVQKDVRKKPKTPRTPKAVRIPETLAETRDAAFDEPSPSGVEEKELQDTFEVDGVTDIVWSCYYCKLDFKQRSDMEDHTQAEHSINLKDCVMYSLEKGASDVSLYELEQDNAADVLPSTPEADVDGPTQLHCDLCGFKGRRLSDLKRHFKLKHCVRENGVSSGKKSCKRPQENSTLAQNKKLKSVDSSSSSEGSTILAKLLQNDDPNYVYKPSTSSSDCVGRDKKMEAGFSRESPDRRPSIARAVDPSEEISVQMKVLDEGKVAEAPKFSGENCLQNLNSSSPDEEPDMEVNYLTRLMCNYCGYLGNNPAEVERHTKIHTGEKNYWCTCCDYKTIWRCDIKKHLEKFHPKEMDTPERLRSLLHSAFRPDGKHTMEELGFRKTPRKDKGENLCDGSVLQKKSHPLNLKCKKDETGTLNSSEKLLDKAKKNLLLQKVLQPKSANSDEGHELNSRETTTVAAPVIVHVDNERASSSAPEIATVKPPCQKLPRKQTDRCRPFKCSVCGKRSNWKWDLKKHIIEQHPEATIITLNKEEAQKTFAEMLRLHQEKLRLAGHAPGSRRIRIVTSQDQNKSEGQASEIPASADNVEAAVGKMSSRKPLLLAGRSILKGMVDLQKLKRFKCSGCIYRSNFRGDISRHIRSRHSSIRCSVIVMPADVATASLRSYESRWSMRKIDPSVVVESSGNASGNSLRTDVVHNLGDTSANREDFGEDANDKWKSGQKIKQLDSASLMGKRALGGGNGRKNGADAEEGETVKRREKLSQVEEDDLKCCTICPYVTEKSDVLKLHMSYHQPQARNGYSCTFCPYFVNTERLLHHHLQLHMSKESLAAQKPDITHTTKNSTSFDSKYICEFCPYVSKLRSNYWAHRKNHFEKPNALFKCSFCRYWTKDQRHLSQHTKLHEKSYFPKLLLPPNGEQKRDNDNGRCRCVFAEDNGDERFRCGETLKCPYCSYAIPSLRLLRQHMIFHVSFTDAVKNLFFHKKFDGADDYLFVHCKNRPLDDDECASGSEENVFLTEPRHPMHLFPFGSTSSESASYELLGGNPVEAGFLPSNALSRGPDDAISVHSIDTDLPELDRFSSGNSDILDRRASPVFLEAVLMEDLQEFSDLPLDETVSVVELPESSGAVPLNEAVAVVELSLREFLRGGKRFYAPDARNLKEPNKNEVIELLEEGEPMEVQLATEEESENVAIEDTSFDQTSDSAVVSEYQLVSAQNGSSKSGENIYGEKAEVVGESGISPDLSDGSLVTHSNTLTSLETAKAVTGLPSKDNDASDGISSYEGIQVESDTDKMLKSANELSSSRDGKCLSDADIGFDSKLGLQMLEKNNPMPSESDNITSADSATKESTPEDKLSSDVPANGCGVLEHAPNSGSVYAARGISLESSRPSTTVTNKQSGNVLDGEVSLTDVCPVFHKDGFKEDSEKTSSDDDTTVKLCDYEVDYFRSFGLVKVKFI